MATGGILQRLTLRPVLFSNFINNLSDGLRCTFIKILNNTKMGRWEWETGMWRLPAC